MPTSSSQWVFYVDSSTFNAPALCHTIRALVLRVPFHVGEIDLRFSSNDSFPTNARTLLEQLEVPLVDEPRGRLIVDWSEAELAAKRYE